jgi:hypothetical protein
MTKGIKRVLTMRAHPGVMSVAQRIVSNEIWLQQVFSAEAARSGGVVRRKVADVERKIGRRAFELEVRQRGWHLLLCGGQYVVVCSREPIRIIV